MGEGTSDGEEANNVYTGMKSFSSIAFCKLVRLDSKAKVLGSSFLNLKSSTGKGSTVNFLMLPCSQ